MISVFIRTIAYILFASNWFIPTQSWGATAACIPLAHAIDEVVVNDLNKGNLKAVVSLDVKTSTPLPDFKLSFDGGASYVAYAEERIAPGQDSTAQTVSVVFSNVNQTQFEALKNYYSGDSATPNQASFAAFAQGKPTIDKIPIEIFMPPGIQAWINKEYIEKNGSQFLRNGKFITTTTNCWSTLYEAARHRGMNSENYNLFIIPAEDARALITSDNVTQVVGRFPFKDFIAMDFASHQKLLKRDDLLVISLGPSFFHMATVLDANFIYEKPDYSDRRPFRFNTIDRLSSGDDASSFPGTTVEIRRWINVKTLPPILDQQLPSKATWVVDPVTGIYLDTHPIRNFPDPYLSPYNRVEFFKIKFDKNGVAYIDTTNSDR